MLRIEGRNGLDNAEKLQLENSRMGLMVLRGFLMKRLEELVKNFDEEDEADHGECKGARIELRKWIRQLESIN